MYRDNSNVWKDIELRKYPDPFCTSYQISRINKKARSKTPLKLRHISNWCSWTPY